MMGIENWDFQIMIDKDSNFEIKKHYKENIKIKKIFVSSIVELIIQILFLFLAIFAIIIYFKTTTGYKDQDGNISFPISPVWISFLVVSFLLLVMNSILSSILLMSNWESEYCNKFNKLWGLLSMFLLGAIAVLIFGKKSGNGQILWGTQ
ncbi:MAG: hypothetical protein K2I49_01250 [Ureaplasma sp.]|nr:hypothetical protein [Ureaplasma sp.]